MKKITLVLAFIVMITLQSCTVNEDNQNPIDNDTISEVWEYTNVNFQPNSYSVILSYPRSIYTSDMVLVYRLSGQFQGEDIWKLQPETFFFDDGTLDFEYNFNFTRYDAEVYMNGFDLQTVSNQYRLNQVFRVVVVPGFFGKKGSFKNKEYKQVIKTLNIDESKIKRIE
jgi:hypothetical protein